MPDSVDLLADVMLSLNEAQLTLLQSTADVAIVQAHTQPHSECDRTRVDVRKYVSA